MLMSRKILDLGAKMREPKQRWASKDGRSD
jgi:hypothetical protein